MLSDRRQRPTLTADATADGSRRNSEENRDPLPIVSHAEIAACNDSLIHSHSRFISRIDLPRRDDDGTIVRFDKNLDKRVNDDIQKRKRKEKLINRKTKIFLRYFRMEILAACSKFDVRTRIHVCEADSMHVRVYVHTIIFYRRVAGFTPRVSAADFIFIFTNMP